MTRQVWLLNHYAQEPGNAGGTRHFGLARYLAGHGWKMSILAASVELNTGRQRLEKDEQFRLNQFDGINFMWVRVPTYSGNGPGRLKNMLSFTFRVLDRKATEQLDPPALVIGSSVHPFAAWSGLRLARRHKVPFIFEVRDLWPQTLIDLGRVTENGLIARLMRMLERHLYKHAAMIVTLLPRADEYIVPLGIPAERIAWIPNGVDLPGSEPPPPADESDSFSFMYFGAHGTANGLENLLHAMQKIEASPGNDGIRLRLIGNGPAKQELTELAAALGLKRVSFEPPVAKSMIPSLAAEADAFIFNLVSAPVFRYGISSNKLFDFMAAARPIIFCCEAGNNPVAEAGCGETIMPGNPDALARAMQEMAALPTENRQAMGKKGFTYVLNQHGYKALASRLAAVLNEATT